MYVSIASHMLRSYVYESYVILVPEPTSTKGDQLCHHADDCSIAQIYPPPAVPLFQMVEESRCLPSAPCRQTQPWSPAWQQGLACTPLPPWSLAERNSRQRGTMGVSYTDHCTLGHSWWEISAVSLLYTHLRGLSPGRWNISQNKHGRAAAEMAPRFCGRKGQCACFTPHAVEVWMISWSAYSLQNSTKECSNSGNGVVLNRCSNLPFSDHIRFT